MINPVVPPIPPAGYDRFNADGSTAFPRFTANDFQAFLTAHAVCSGWERAWMAAAPRPVLGLRATVSASSVALAWTNATAMQTRLVVVRDGEPIAELPGQATSFSHTVEPGTYTYSVEPGNLVGGVEYPVTPGQSHATAEVVVSGSGSGGGGGGGVGGWTQFPLPAEAIAIYVSPSTGDDTGPGTQQAPLRTLQAALARVRNGVGDQIYIRRGDGLDFTGDFFDAPPRVIELAVPGREPVVDDERDVEEQERYFIDATTAIDVTKGGTPMHPLVIGAYGTGARPRLQFSGSGLQIQAPNVAIVDLEIAGTNAVDSSGIIALDKANILIEGCCVRNFRDNIVIHSLGSTRIPGVKIRRNVITDAKQPTGERSQGIYIGHLDNWVIEENVFDRCGIVGSMFSRPVYVHESCSRGVFRGNIMARSPAEGVQVRPGGIVEDNLVLRCPIGMFVGNDVAGTNSVKRNVVIESGDINATDRRGVGIDSAGQQDTAFNIVAYNTGTGWGSVQGLVIKGGGSATDNYVWNWTRDPAMGGPGSTDDAQGINIEGGGGTLTLSRNVVHQVRKGQVCRRMPTGPSVVGTGNVYSGDPATQGGLLVGTAGTWSQTARPADPQLRGLLPGGGIDAFIEGAKLQSKQNWRAEYTAADFNARARGRVGMVGG